jgi:hypothetical protein
MVTIALGGFLPATALAETRYVAKGGSNSTACTSAATPCLTVQYAVEQAAAGDTVQIGPGDFYESVVANVPLNFVGTGAGQIGSFPAKTQIRGLNGSSSSGSPGLQLKAGGSIESLRVEGGAGASVGTFGESGGDALDYTSASATPSTLQLENAVLLGGKGGKGTGGFEGSGGDAINVDGGPGAVALSATHSQFRGGTGFGGGGALWVSGPAAEAHLSDSQILNEGIFSGAVFGYGGAQITLDDVEAEAGGPLAATYEGSLTIRRSRLHSISESVYAATSANENPRIQIVDSLLVSDTGLALSVESTEGGTAAAEVLGSTLIGNYLAAVEAVRTESGGPASVILRNTIVYVTQRLTPFFPPVDLKANGGQIVADYSSFSTRTEENGGSISAPGSAHNVAGDPGFVDGAHGIYILGNTSPLIDRGDPGIVAPGELDLLSAPRSLDGNRDCVAAPDIGAFEVTGQSVACNAKPVVSGFGMTNRVFAPVGGAKGAKGRPVLSSGRGVKHGTEFTYSMSEPAQVTISIERKRHRRMRKLGSLTAKKQAGKQSTRFSGRLHGKPLKPGSYRATILAIDSSGLSSAPHRVTFRVVRG